MTSILHISSSTTGDASNTRAISNELVARLTAANPGATVTERNLVDGVPQLTQAATAELAGGQGNYSPEAAAVLETSDALIAELVDADVVVIGAPIYNFGVPSSLKAWADLVARAGVTFTYSENGPQGLVADRPVYIVAAAGGVPIGSEMDFGTGWLQLFLGFLGMTNVTVIGQTGFAIDPASAMADALAQVEAAPLPAAPLPA